MICQFKRLIYPKAVTAGDASYMIALYRPCEKVMDAAGNVVSEIKAVGYCLPTADNLRYDMRGRWSRSAKHGIQFEVEGFDEVIVPSKEGVIAYLCSGQIKGIGPKTAEKIYAMFGQNTLTVLDHEPEQLLAVSGISKTKLKKICDSYLASRGARDVVAFLAPHGVTPNRAVKLYKQYGEHTMDIVRNHPYRLCEMVGIGFKTADRIAVSMGFDPLSPERVDEGLIFTLTDAELKGHLCMEKHSFLKQCLKLLDTEGLTEEMLAVRASRMLESGRLPPTTGRYTVQSQRERNRALRGLFTECLLMRKRGLTSTLIQRSPQKKKAGYTAGFRTAARSYDGPDITAQCDYWRTRYRQDADPAIPAGYLSQEKPRSKNYLLCAYRTRSPQDGAIDRVPGHYHSQSAWASGR